MGIVLRVVLFSLIMVFQDCSGQTNQKPPVGANKIEAGTPRPGQVPPQKNGNDMENLEGKNIPKLDVSVENTGASLIIDYKVKNVTATPIYLFNVLYEWDNSGTPIVVPNTVYTCMRKDGTLHLAEIILPLPSQKMVEVRRIPYATKVGANEEFRRKIEIKIPVEEYNPYFPKKPDSQIESRLAEYMIFSIQFLRESDKVEVLPTTIPNAVSVDHPDLFHAVETLSSPPKPVGVKVNKRLDAFEEF
jgi:hypothetical protein